MSKASSTSEAAIGSGPNAPRLWEERYRALVTGAPVLLVETDLEGRLLFGAETLARMLGCSWESSRNPLLGSWVGKALQTNLQRVMDRVRLGESVRRTEMVLQCPDTGVAIEYAVSCVPIRDPHNEVIGMRMVGSDLDMEKSLAYALEAAEERFSVLFRESSDPVLILSMDGEILSANMGFERYTGIQSVQLFGGEKHWADCVHPDDLPPLRTRIAACVQEDRDELVEIRLLSEEGFYQWFEQSLSVLHDEIGHTRGIVAVARNINRRKELESHLREKAQTLQRRHQRAQLLVAKLKHFFTKVSALPSDIDGYLSGVCDSLNEMYGPYAVLIRVTMEGGGLYQAGRRPVRITESGPATVMCRQIQESGMPLYCNSLNLTDPYRDDPMVKELGLITYLGAPLRDSTGVVRGSLFVVDNEKRYYDNVDVELITVAALHVAARLRGEEQETLNRELSDHLRQVQKMDAVGMLAGGIAHDFNNILSGILGFSSYLLSKVDPETTIHRDLKLIEKSAVRAADLTRQLLSFSRRKHFNKAPVSMNGVIEDVLAILRRSIPKHIVIDDELEESLPNVLGDQGQLNQVIMNVCLNAVDAMSEMETGTLRLTTRSRKLTPRERTLLSNPADETYVCITASDTGIGMSEEIQEHIYEPFYTTKSEKGGTGLGLSIVYGIVSSHDGQVVVDSEKDQGTVFTLYFPVHDGEASVDTEDEPGLLTGTETILVIDDESIVRQMVTEVLRGSGYKVVAAESGMEGIRFFDELRGRIDLVLLDMVMPEMDGEATFKGLRRIDPKLPILLTSGYVQEGKSARLLRAGALGLVNKPYKSTELLKRIRKALQSVKVS